ncbi:MAG: Lrp/AsnC family transcriptional regulator [Nanoarchaeota archaeon]
MLYKIDEIDKRILFELDKNARIPEIRLAKLIGKSKEAVRYRIKRMIEEKIIIGFTTWIDPTKLGYQLAKIYLNLANVPHKKKELIEYLKKDKRLFWLGVAEGAWNIGATFFVKDMQEFFDLKNELFTKFKEVIHESTTATVVSVHTHDKTFLYKNTTSWTTIFDNHENNSVDALSIKILKSLFKNCRENIATIAHDHITTVDKIRTRMHRLEEDKIIVKYTIELDFQKLGYEFYKTFLYFKNLSKNELGRLMNYVLHHPNIIFIVKQISPWDLELETMCESYEEYNRIINALTEEFVDSITKFDTAIISEDHVFPAEKMVFE